LDKIWFNRRGYTGEIVRSPVALSLIVTPPSVIVCSNGVYMLTEPCLKALGASRHSRTIWTYQQKKGNQQEQVGSMIRDKSAIA